MSSLVIKDISEAFEIYSFVKFSNNGDEDYTVIGLCASLSSLTVHKINDVVLDENNNILYIQRSNKEYVKLEEEANPKLESVHPSVINKIENFLGLKNHEIMVHVIGFCKSVTSIPSDLFFIKNAQGDDVGAIKGLLSAEIVNSKEFLNDFIRSKEDFKFIEKTINKIQRNRNKYERVRYTSLRFYREDVDTNYKIIRLDDHQYNYLRQQSVIVLINGVFSEYSLDLEKRVLGGQWLRNSHFHFIMTYLFGGSSFFIYDHKQSFCYPFLLTVARDGKENVFLLEIRNYRSCLEFKLYKMFFDQRVNHKKPEELSEEEVGKIVSGIINKIKIYFDIVHSDGAKLKTPFLYKIPSELMVYGFDGEKFFDVWFSDDEKFYDLVDDDLIGQS